MKNDRFAAGDRNPGETAPHRSFPDQFRPLDRPRVGKLFSFSDTVPVGTENLGPVPGVHR